MENPVIVKIIDDRIEALIARDWETYRELGNKLMTIAVLEEKLDARELNLRI